MKATISREEMTAAQTWSILSGAAMMLTLAMGMRQSLGLFQPHMIRELGITAADFSFAIALQNIIWGATQPFIGAIVDRIGARPVAVAGAFAYACGIAISAFAQSAFALMLGSGVCIGIALSCTASNLAMSVTSRAVSPLRRSVAMGSVSAVGSLGLMLASPLAQSLISSHGWQIAMLAFLGLAAIMLPSAYFAGGVDRVASDATPQNCSHLSSRCIYSMRTCEKPFQTLVREVQRSCSVE